MESTNFRDTKNYWLHQNQGKFTRWTHIETELSCEWSQQFLATEKIMDFTKTSQMRMKTHGFSLWPFWRYTLTAWLLKEQLKRPIFIPCLSFWPVRLFRAPSQSKGDIMFRDVFFVKSQLIKTVFQRTSLKIVTAQENRFLKIVSYRTFLCGYRLVLPRMDEYKYKHKYY